MAMHPSGLTAAFETVRRTNASHVSALAALENAFDAETAQLASDRQTLEDDRAAMSKEVDDKLARGEATLADKRAAVEHDRAEVDDEKVRMRAAAPLPDKKIKINVGGARFETSRSVLTKVEDSMLGRMFGRCDAMLQADPEDGSIFIDRDGERFRLILDFLRDLDGAFTQKRIGALPEVSQEAMARELDYFGLEAAVFGPRPWTNGATFRPGPAMCRERCWCAAVTAGGRVIVFGGGSFAEETTELLETQTMAFTNLPDMRSARSGCAAVQIDADRVLLVGGADGNQRALNTTEIFHLSTRTFTAGPGLLSARGYCAAVALDACRVLVVGGHDDASELPSTEILSLDTMIFAPGPAMTTPRSQCAAVALDEHRVLVAGGSSGLASCLDTTEILDVGTMAFAPGPSMSSCRVGCAAVAVDARHVLIIGGVSTTSALATTALLDVTTMEFADGPALQAARWGCAAVVFGSAAGKRIFVLGGENEEDSLGVTEVLSQ